MGKLNQFCDTVSDIEDVEVLNAAKQILADLVEMAKIRERLAYLEEHLSDGHKGVFYFFTLGLTDDEITLASNNVNGRLRHLSEMAERAKQREAARNPSKSEDASGEESEQP
jgi:hypothetical protein